MTLLLPKPGCGVTRSCNLSGSPLDARHWTALVSIMKSPDFSKMFAGWLKMWKDLQGDRLHVVILFFLYCLQGIPLGLDSAIPLILSRRNVPYAEQATFSISTYPFSMKVRNSSRISQTSTQS